MDAMTGALTTSKSFTRRPMRLATTWLISYGIVICSSLLNLVAAFGRKPFKGDLVPDTFFRLQEVKRKTATWITNCSQSNHAGQQREQHYVLDAQPWGVDAFHQV